MKAIIDLKQILKNAKDIELKTNKKLICVVKSNAYNLGSYEVASYLYEHGYQRFAVVCIEEAKQLITQKFKGEILILNSITEEDLSFVNQNKEIIISVNSLEDAKMIAYYKWTRQIKVHIQVETGMNRLGFKDIDNCKKAISLLQDENIDIEGIYTHYTSLKNKNHQEEIFKKFINLYDFKIIHSGATPTYTESIGNYVRVGMDLYGDNKDNQALSVYVKPIAINKIKKGETIGYNENYKCLEDMMIAVMPLGYNDGIIRKMSGDTLVARGNEYKIVGNICMNHLFVKIDDESLINEEFIITSKENTLTKHAKYLGTISYEVQCLMRFTDREYIK